MNEQMNKYKKNVYNKLIIKENMANTKINFSKLY